MSDERARSYREALQDYLRSLPPEQARDLIGSSAPELVKLVPEVESIIPDITPNPPMGELEAERLRLLRAAPLLSTCTWRC